MKLIIVIGIWLVAVGGSFHFLMNYSSEEGRVGNVSNSWPANTKLKLNSEYQIVMFVHPGCTCSMASLSELSRLMAREEELSAQIIFMKSKKLLSLLKDNELHSKAKLLPRTEIFFDDEGVEAKNFGALTSGQSYLYHKNKGLLFSGGLTVARGHEGRSPGQVAIEDILKKRPSRSIASVFGCEIFNTLITTDKK